ncbi:hypothetical protein [Herbaspirillum sp. SJZ107]|uniref:hypothetical protein n=1 Tax=Herbaspirillum sp. SJZ107 TaxID=2572881 RepID=UPI001173B85A|nr:hypothetical protein [Herbaspirillum sp. SJZ107]TQK11370.1 hypothetical protein FBX97_1310 [Herbaspirillum sp. SJZ107]
MPIVTKRIIAAAFAAGGLFAHPADAAEPAASALTVGGAIRFNYVHKSWQDDYPGGFVGLDTARLDLNYDDGTVIGSAQYRYNRFPKGQGGYWQHFLHHGWAGIRLADKSELHVGLDRNPFGLQPLASNNFYESIAFYAGLEDKYDLGVTYLSDPGPFEWQLAFYPRDGGSYGGGSNTAAASNRYSYNIVPDDDAQGYGTGQRDRERDTLVGRMAWHVGPGANYEIGVSGLTGAIDNGRGTRTRRHAVAVHAQGAVGPVKVMLEALRYRYGTAHGPTQTYAGLDPNSFVMLGAFGYPFPVASKGDIYLVNVSHDIPGRLGPLGGFRVYNDYSVLRKRSGAYKDSVQNVTGMSFSSGKWTFYADFMLGKHHPYLSPDGGGLAAASAAHDGFTRRINLQAGYYF